MIKVLNVISDTNIGGAGRLLLNCLQNSDKSVFQTKVILPENSLLKPEIEKLGFSVIEIEGNKDKSFDFNSIKELFGIFKEERPDIVHTHASMSGRIAAFLAGVKTKVYTKHCAFEPSKRMTSFPFKQINGFIDNILTNRIIATAHIAKENLEATGIKRDKIDVILNGTAPLSEFSEQEIKNVKEQLNIGEDEFVCGIVARLEEYKGQKYFIEALNILKNEKIKGIIVGDGSKRQTFINQVIELGIKDKIIFTGFKKNVAPFMNILDVNINCSYLSETSCLALSEGMSFGKPSIATICGGNSDMVQDGVTGILIQPEDANALANAIKRLMSDTELYKNMSVKAKELYQNNFTAAAMTKELEKIYKEEAGVE